MGEGRMKTSSIYMPKILLKYKKSLCEFERDIFKNEHLSLISISSRLKDFFHMEA